MALNALIKNSTFHPIQHLAIWRLFEVPLLIKDGAYYLNEDGAYYPNGDGAYYLNGDGAYYPNEDGACYLTEDRAYYLTDDGAWISIPTLIYKLDGVVPAHPHVMVPPPLFTLFPSPFSA